MSAFDYLTSSREAGPPGTGVAWSRTVRGMDMGVMKIVQGVGPFGWPDQDTTRDWIADPSPGEQFRRCVANLRTILTSNGIGWDEIHAIWLHIQDWEDLESIDEAWAEAFTSDTPPARSVFRGQNIGSAKVVLDAFIGDFGSMRDYVQVDEINLYHARCTRMLPVRSGDTVSLQADFPRKQPIYLPVQLIDAIKANPLLSARNIVTVGENYITYWDSGFWILGVEPRRALVDQIGPPFWSQAVYRPKTAISSGLWHVSCVHDPPHYTEVEALADLDGRDWDATTQEYGKTIETSGVSACYYDVELDPDVVPNTLASHIKAIEVRAVLRREIVQQPVSVSPDNVLVVVDGTEYLGDWEFQEFAGWTVFSSGIWCRHPGTGRPWEASDLTDIQIGINAATASSNYKLMCDWLRLYVYSTNVET